MDSLRVRETRNRLSVQSISCSSGSFAGDDVSLPSAASGGESSAESWLCAVGTDLQNDERVQESAKVLGLKVAHTSEANIPNEVPSGCNLAFIMAEFDGTLFDRLWSKVKALRSNRVRILGPPCLHYCAAAKVSLPLSRRPIYSFSMSDLAVCFMGFRSSEKKEMDTLVTQVRYMGADVRTDISEVSHVVATGVTSSRYEKAVALGKSIMSTKWVETCWEKRMDLHVRATDDDLMQLRLPPFTELTLSFWGFSDDDRQQMESFCELNGCSSVPFGEPCTHVVCNVETTAELGDIPQGAVAVKADWFWESIQICACSNINLHLFQPAGPATPVMCRSPGIFNLHSSGYANTPSPRRLGASTSFTFRTIAHVPSVTSTSAVATPGVSTPDVRVESNLTAEPETPAAAKLRKKLAERRNKCLELQETEINYVSILDYIVKNYVDQLDLPNQRGGAILNPEEVKEIFYPLPQLAALHQKMLAGLQSRFSVSTITDSTCFGDILLEHVEEMIRIYPRFINFYEARQECVLQKSKTNPRFTAFMQLRYSEAAKERGPFSKQKLTELLITPVQRMPRYLLLLDGIIKLTAEDHSDKAQLVKALEGFKTAAQRINDDKRIAEDRIKMLNLPNLVECLPPTTVNSARTIVNLVPNLVLVEAADGENVEIPVCLIIFNDSIEITKRRGNLESVSMDDFNAAAGSRHAGKRMLRHIDFILLAEVRRILRFYADKEQAAGDLFGMALSGTSSPSSSSAQQEQWIVFRALAGPNTSASTVATNIINCLVKTREGMEDAESKLLIHPMPCTKLPFYNEGSMEGHQPTGLTKAIKGAKSKARRVTRVFSQQFHHRLDHFHAGHNQ